MERHRGHADGPDLAALASLLADATRASFCLALLDGRAWTAAESASRSHWPRGARRSAPAWTGPSAAPT